MIKLLKALVVILSLFLLFSGAVAGLGLVFHYLPVWLIMVSSALVGTIGTFIVLVYNLEP